MNIDQKLTAIRDVIQRDVGMRGLARDPERNLINACPDDFANACRSVAEHRSPVVQIVTGFWIPTAVPPAFETDGPLGSVFLAFTLDRLRIPTTFSTEFACIRVLEIGLRSAGIKPGRIESVNNPHPGAVSSLWVAAKRSRYRFPTHSLAIERPGPGANGRCYSMRGRDVTQEMLGLHALFGPDKNGRPIWHTMGIGDGGNEIGMGKIPHETIVRNIPNGDLIHCRVATDHLIVAGVSNWGAYALAAGVALLRGVKLPAELFDPDRERAILQTMVDAGPLVDGVTGKQTATVDGLSWEDYIRPLEEIRRIVEA